VILEAIEGAQGFERIKALDDAVDQILLNDETKQWFLFLAGQVSKRFKAILPDEHANEFLKIRELLGVIVEKIESYSPIADISGVVHEVEQLLDSAVVGRGYIEGKPPTLVHLRSVDFGALRDRFRDGRATLR